MTKRSILVRGAIAVVLVTLISTAAAADDNPIEEQWPSEVPTPWFCVGWPPNDVCVPPW